MRALTAVYPFPLLIATVLAIGSAPFPLHAQLTYSTNSGAIAVTGYTGADGAVTIPTKVAELPVTTIADHAFFNSSSVTTVSIPESVTNIGVSALAKCSNLLSISVSVGNPGFSSVDGVLFDRSQQVLIQCPGGKAGAYTTPSSAQALGYGAFHGCDRLTSITVVAATNIADGAFVDCSALTNIALPDTIISLGSWLFSGCSNLRTLRIPEKLTGIRPWTFASFSGLTSVTVPNRVTDIGAWAFQDCISLEKVTIGNGVTNIPRAAFARCTQLTNLTVEALNPVYSSFDGVLFNKSGTALLQYPEGRAGNYAVPSKVSIIGGSAFSGCFGLTDLVVPDTVTEIGPHAFYGCAGLTNVAIGNGVAHIGESAFCLCVNLHSVTLPDTVTSISDYLFEDCYSLAKVRLGNAVTSIGRGAFASCTNLPSVIIPQGVTNIGWFAFAGTGLTNVVFPETVTSIGWSAFASCTGLTGIYFQGNAPAGLGDGVFAQDTKAIVYYLPHTTGWGPRFGERPTTLWKPRIQLNDYNFGVRTNAFGFTVGYSPGTTIVVESAADLSNPGWVPIITNTLAGDSVFFTDPQWTNHASRFYRVRGP